LPFAECAGGAVITLDQAGRSRQPHCFAELSVSFARCFLLYPPRGDRLDLLLFRSRPRAHMLRPRLRPLRNRKIALLSGRYPPLHSAKACSQAPAQKLWAKRFCPSAFLNGGGSMYRGGREGKSTWSSLDVKKKARIRGDGDSRAQITWTTQLPFVNSAMPRTAIAVLPAPIPIVRTKALPATSRMLPQGL
jgi:hypothetical protein